MVTYFSFLEIFFLPDDGQKVKSKRISVIFSFYYQILIID